MWAVVRWLVQVVPLTVIVSDKGYEGAVKGWSWGGEGGKWTHRAVSGYDPEDYAISTDPGKFDVSQRFDFEDINRQFEEAERARFWKDVTGTGKTIAATLALGAKDEGSVWDYYSTENEKSLYIWWTKSIWSRIHEK